MKLWRFFLKNEFNNKFQLIAMTTDKKIADAFRLGRNNEFIERVGDFDEDELSEYLVQYRGNVLRYESIKTYLNKNTDNQTPISVDVLMTEHQSMTIDELMDSGVYGLLEFNLINPEIFNDSLFKSLKYLDYIDAYQLITGYTVDGSDDFPDVNWKFDALALFMLVYQDELDETHFLETVRYKKRDVD